MTAHRIAMLMLAASLACAAQAGRNPPPPPDGSGGPAPTPTPTPPPRPPECAVAIEPPPLAYPTRLRTASQAEIAARRHAFVEATGVPFQDVHVSPFGTVSNAYWPGAPDPPEVAGLPRATTTDAQLHAHWAPIFAAIAPMLGAPAVPSLHACAPDSTLAAVWGRAGEHPSPPLGSAQLQWSVENGRGSLWIKGAEHPPIAMPEADPALVEDLRTRFGTKTTTVILDEPRYPCDCATPRCRECRDRPPSSGPSEHTITVRRWHWQEQLVALPVVDDDGASSVEIRRVATAFGGDVEGNVPVFITPDHPQAGHTIDLVTGEDLGVVMCDRYLLPQPRIFACRIVPDPAPGAQ